MRANNPSLAAARWRIAEAEARLQGAGLRDNPELEVGFEHNSTLREGRIEVGLSQRFPVTDRLSLEKKVSATEVLQARAEVENVERTLIVEARALLIEVIGLRKQQSLRAEQAQVAASLAEFITKAASKGELSPLDAGQAKLDSAKLKAEIPSLKAAELAATGKLKPLLGMRPADTLHIAGNELPSPRFAKNAVQLNARPDYQAAQLAAQASAQSIALEEAKRYDDIEVGVVAGLERSEDAPEGYESEGVIGLRVKLALPFWQKNEGAIQEARARTTRKQLETAALEEEIKHEAEAAYQEMLEWASLVRSLDQDLLPQAAEQASQSEKAYREGLGDLQAILRAREQQLQLADSQIETLKQFHLARVRYEAVTGQN
ncbi:hypothetical protein GCM10007100_16810 [Roseibacillus persicicus]|uniref:Transporter n=1 Tax=Roseibacillus persicicus TaxID=454148 RepID=A0A918TM84_9BACT|nr:hypothetical protein GCM10007100_16810 [Roseibacillus persicicus]